MAENASGIPDAARGLIAGSRRRLVLFAAATLAWGVVFFALWHAASTPVSALEGWVAARAIEAFAPVDDARASADAGTVVIEVQPDASVRYRTRIPAGMLFSIPVNARKYTVALPFFFALVAAAGLRRAGRVIVGVSVLLIAGGLGIACEAAIGFATNTAPFGAPLLKPGVVIASGLALAFQLSTLLVPTLVPIALWFWVARGTEVAGPGGPIGTNADLQAAGASGPPSIESNRSASNRRQ